MHRISVCHVETDQPPPPPLVSNSSGWQIFCWLCGEYLLSNTGLFYSTLTCIDTKHVSLEFLTVSVTTRTSVSNIVRDL